MEVSWAAKLAGKPDAKSCQVRQVARYWAPLLAAFAVACGPDGMQGDGDDAVMTSVTLVADELGALFEQRCTQEHGSERCAPYPNPAGCEAVVVTVRVDATTDSECQLDGEPRRLDGMVQGVPIRCQREASDGCVRCRDLYGRLAFDSCSGRAVAAAGFGQLGDGFTPREVVQTIVSGQTQPNQPTSELAQDGVTPDLQQPAPQSPTLPPAAPRSQSLCFDQGVQRFAEALNGTLEREGVPFRYAPQALRPDERSGGSEFCKHQYYPACDEAAEAEGRCFCAEDNPLELRSGRKTTKTGAMCQCGRIKSRAALAACGHRGRDCRGETTYGAFQQGVQAAYADASRWLAKASSSGGTSALSIASAPSDIVCLNSPLVLDLAGDGVALTSAADGASFDLVGAGPMPTAWVQGRDDALLAIDRNGNGRIDGGHELFGEAPSLAGVAEPDGFAALRRLDTSRFGGNENGIIDPTDALFGALVLWRDRNGDARSSAEELTPLTATDIVAIGTRGDRSGGKRFDIHGNEIGLRGVFVRRGGQVGTLVDAYLTSR